MKNQIKSDRSKPMLGRAQEQIIVKCRLPSIVRQPKERCHKSLFEQRIIKGTSTQDCKA